MRFKMLLTLILLMPIVGVATFALLHRTQKPLFKVFGVVPGFTLTDRTGQRLSLADLQGKVWVANFIFTSCHGQCPLMSDKMKALQSKLKGVKRVRFVSFSVDPERDNPGVLNEYAYRWGAEPLHWYFLTGTAEQIHALVKNGFRLAIDDTSEEITHSFYFALVDKKGQIRKYYDGLEDVVDEMAIDVRSLTEENV